jgi:transcriptional regulator with XRE-family HTH domain
VTARQQKVPAVFGQRLKRERERRGWSMRNLSTRSGTTINSISRAERGGDVNLSTAIAMATALGLPLGVLLGEKECARCDGKPPAGFICMACGQGGGA